MNADPVFRDVIDGQWYFYDETWAHRLGPYSTEQEARAHFAHYCELYLN